MSGHAAVGYRYTVRHRHARGGSIELKGIELSEDLFDPQDAIWAEVWHQAEVATLGAALPHWTGRHWPAGACLTLHREAKVAPAREPTLAIAVSALQADLRGLLVAYRGQVLPAPFAPGLGLLGRVDLARRTTA